MFNMFDSKMPGHLLLAFLMFIRPWLVNSITCFSCDRMPYPHDCTYVTECATHQKCYVDQFVTPDGHVFYRSGCRDTLRCGATRRLSSNMTSLRQVSADVRTCEYCCNSHICNSGGCGNTGLLQRPNRGPVCYSCSQQSDVNTCNHVHMCMHDEVCKIGTVMSLVDLVYSTGCQKSSTCTTATNGGSYGHLPLGKRKSSRTITQQCTNCCSSDLCNKQCSGTSGGSIGSSVLPNYPSIKDCFDIFRHNSRSPSGKYTIYGRDGTPREVICDMTNEGGGWTAFQRRRNSSENFYRNWNDYKTGFGHIDSNFYLGNDLLHQLADPATHNELLIYLESFDGQLKHAKYSEFSVSNEQDGYRLHVNGYSGTAGNSLGYHNGMKFSTYDVDHDVDSSNCAELSHGGWWYRKCFHSNLNGVYRGGPGMFPNDANANSWLDFNYSYEPLKMSVMLVRRVV